MSIIYNKRKTTLCYLYGKTLKTEKLNIDLTYYSTLSSQTGTLIDKRYIDESVKEIKVLIDNIYLSNDILYFKSTVPTRENVIIFIFNKISAFLQKNQSKCKLYEIELQYENNDKYSYKGENKLIDII